MLWLSSELEERGRYLVERTIATDERVPLPILKERTAQQVTVGKGVDRNVEEGGRMFYLTLLQVG
jgi:hypothetical protein